MPASFCFGLPTRGRQELAPMGRSYSGVIAF